MLSGKSYVTILAFLTLTLPTVYAEKPESLGHGEFDSEARQSTPATYHVNKTSSEWTSVLFSEAFAGRSLFDIEVEEVNGVEKYSGVFMARPSGTTMHYLTQGTSSEWSDFLDEVGPLNGRFLDVEVDYFDGNKKYSAIFYEDGDNYGYAVFTTNNEDQFQDRLRVQQESQRYIVDFESYTVNDTTYYAAIWAADPNQPITTLYYGLESPDVSDLIRPLEGRIIDFERYYSEPHDEFRYGVIVATYPGNEWGLWRNQSEANLQTRHDAIADSNTIMADLEFWDAGTDPLYAAVWGDTFGPLHEVNGYPSETNPLPRTARLNSLIDDFETDLTDVSGDIGFFARNLITGHSIGYREEELFYLASVAKVPMHIRLFQEIQQGDVSLNDTIQYTQSANSLSPWFVDDRPLPGMASCLCDPSDCQNNRPSDMGQNIPVSRIDQAMMQVSDNAATGMLLDNDQWGLSTETNPDLNEWIGSLDGVARGFGQITSIRKLDRLIVWHGQVMAFPDAPSLFDTPTHLIGQAGRYSTGVTACTDIDGNGVNDLADFFGGTLPDYSWTIGFRRYYNTSLNQATPKAFVNLLDKFYGGELLDSTQTAAALNVMRIGTSLNDATGFPNGTVTIYAKGGSKGGDSDPRANAAIFEFGGQAIAMLIASKNHIPDPTPPPGGDGLEDILGHYQPEIAYELLQALAADLATFGADQSGGTSSDAGFLPAEAAPGEEMAATFVLVNEGGIDTLSGCDVTFYLSTNQTISTSDYEIGTVRVPPLDPGEDTVVVARFPVPDAPARDYTVGWIIDDDPGESWGEVSEYDENNNTGYYTGSQFTVLEPIQTPTPSPTATPTPVPANPEVWTIE